MVQIDELPHFYNELHYHPEFQITAIVRGEGVLYAGNNMSAFAAGEVFMIGPNVPHLLSASDLYHTDDSPGVKAISLFFDEAAFGPQFFAVKEMEQLRVLLREARRVIKIEGPLKAELYAKITSTPAREHEQLIITFLEILGLLRRATKIYLNAEQYELSLNKSEGGRLNDVLEYTFQNFKREITIEQITKVAFLSRSQFSAFFKRHTGKTYIRFLNELRIENACILLKDQLYTVEQVCYAVGFKNVSNFTRQFKKIKRCTPSAYRRSWRITRKGANTLRQATKPPS